MLPHAKIHGKWFFGGVIVKAKSIALLLFAAIAVYGFSQDSGGALEEIDNSDPLLDSNRLLLHTDTFFSKTLYLWDDGTPATYREVLAGIATVPANESLVLQEKIWRNVTYTTLGLTLASFAGIIAYKNFDFNGPEWLLETCFYTGLFSYLSTWLAGNIANTKLYSAVDRYNLHIGLGR
jgi:hypothetical protein